MAVPIHGPATPHRINMPLALEDEEAAIITKEKQSVMITLRSPLQVIKKSASRGRKKGITKLPRRLTKPVNASSTNHSITDYFPVRRSVRKCEKIVLEEKQRDIENKVVCQIEEGLEVSKIMDN